MIFETWDTTEKDKTSIIREKTEGKEEKMNRNVLFMKIFKRVEFGINLNLIPSAQVQIC